jgi:hypothetical protein
MPLFFKCFIKLNARFLQWFIVSYIIIISCRMETVSSTVLKHKDVASFFSKLLGKKNLELLLYVSAEELDLIMIENTHWIFNHKLTHQTSKKVLDAITKRYGATQAEHLATKMQLNCKRTFFFFSSQIIFFFFFLSRLYWYLIVIIIKMKTFTYLTCFKSHLCFCIPITYRPLIKFVKQTIQSIA